MLKKIVEVSKERDLKTYAEMLNASWYFLQQGMEKKEGYFFQFMASVVFTAFTLEAFLNHVGTRIFKSCWNYLERLGPKEKLDLILDKLDLNMDKGIHPRQVVNELFKIRDQIVHGKSELLTDKEEIPVEHYNMESAYYDSIRTEWENYCTEENAQKVRENIKKIIEIIYNRCGFEDSPFGLGMMSRGAHFIEKDV